MTWNKVINEKPRLGIQYRFLFINGKKEITYGYAYADEEDGIWDTGNESSIWINDMDRKTNELATHWMELPKLPEE